MDLQFQNFLSQQQLANKELMQENASIKIATVAIFGTVSVIGGFAIWVQSKKVRRSNTTEVHRHADGGTTVRHIVTDERPVGNDREDAVDRGSNMFMMALREVAPPIDQGKDEIKNNYNRALFDRYYFVTFPSPSSVSPVP